VQVILGVLVLVRDRVARRILAIAVAVSSAACSLLVDTSGLSGTGDGAPGTQALPSFGNAITLATGQTGITEIASDADAIYWIARVGDGTGTVSRLDRSGGLPLVLASAQFKPTGLAVDSTRVYWANGLPIGGSTAIAAVSKSGGARPASFAVSGWGANDVPALAVRGGQLVFATDVNAAGGVYRIDLSGTTPVLLVGNQGPITALALAPPTTFWSTASAIYALGGDGLDGAAPPPIAEGSATSMLVDDGTLYWASKDGTMHARGVASGSVTSLLAEGLSSPRSLVVDASYVYCACPGSGTVVAVPKKGGDKVVVLRGGEPVGVTVTADALYVADRGAASILRVPKLDSR
jgi:hypothetical protein